ncbi:MAG: hypothetical protein K2P99_02380, partial [Burkholderiales bacterium]|nr:hypothetical protein [Burkholderiales bacterium]
MKSIRLINNEFKSDVSIKNIFIIKTIEQLGLIVNRSIGNFTYKDYLINNIDQKEAFEFFGLSNIQQAYYLGRFGNFELGNISTHSYAEEKFSYLDIVRLEKSFNMLLDRHLVLRTIFVNGNQQFLKEIPYYKITVHELNHEKELLDIRDNLSHKIYIPEIYPLFDIVVSKIDSYYILHISFDALLGDDSSYRIFFDEWTQLYNNPETKLPKLSVSYRDYILQYEKIRESEIFNRAKKYWLAKLEDFTFDINLPLRGNLSELGKPKFERITKVIPKTTWKKLLFKIQQKGISSTALILEAYGKILSFWSGQDKVCINLTLFNRLPLHPQINEIMGDFTILGLFNYKEHPSDSISKKLQNIHDELWNDIEHNLFDGVDLQRLIRKELSISNNKIIAPVVLTSVLGNKKDEENNNKVFIDSSYQGLNYSITQTSQVFLDNKAFETKEGFVAEWDYVEQLFDKKLIEDMHDSYCKLIEYLAEADWDKEQFLPIECPLPDQVLVKKANNNIYDLSSDTLVSRYEQMVIKYSMQDNIAVIDTATDQKYSYKQLINETQLLSKYLLLKNSTINDTYNNKTPEFYHKDKLIAVLSEKGYNQVVSTCAIMKSGHGYLPL